MTFQDLLSEADGHRFQQQLCDFIVENKLETIVETGTGVSTLFILKALDQLGSGHLYSIDANPWFSKPIEHPRLTFIKDKSINVLADLYKKTGPWDLFLHDSDHDCLCQTYEYLFAYNCVKRGGWVASDDVSWGTHKAWYKFIAEFNLSPGTMGSVELAQKHTDAAMALFVTDEMHQFCLSQAQSAEAVYLASGGQNSEVFKSYQ